MQAKYISYQDTGAFSQIVLDYISGEAKLSDFYSFKPDTDGFSHAIRNRRFSGDRQRLVTVLQNQYIEVQTTALVKDNITLLADERTFTITTGHQLNIFTGPLYFIYKIVTAINLAKQLKQEFPEYNFVPVYWMATEDHDFAEINHVRIEEKKLSWNKDNAAGATGRMGIKDIAEVLAAYKGYLGISENGLELAGIVEKAYQGKPGKLSDATRILVDSLFGEYGLVCVDADVPELKQQFADIIRRDIETGDSYKKITSSNEALEALGYKTQVNPREINFFYMLDGLRERIVKEEDKYQILNTEISFSVEELEREIDANPERFSPNVVMRPLYQEVILPNLCYIGGGAELTYWLQLKGNFDRYKIDFPVLMLRNSALIIDKRSAEKMHMLGIKEKELFTDSDQLKSTWVHAHAEHRILLSDEQRALGALFDQIKLNAYKIDKTLSETTDMAKHKALKLIHMLEKKMLKAEKRRHATALSQIEGLKLRLFPGGVLQERVLNIAPMYIAHGKDFIPALIAAFDPMEPKFTILFAS
ncbi:bacillithiol biosynthesis cysteine-adding enzyme BshC [Pedobacter faecalis]|uniref:bacillithiol biosynthesis cysteine-adding enzyme BshC n=1 Tax=Pedobacter faecalis TaxID=3041495 RepID=UPI002551A055|nr:bacillithiol biosynthesis cysteine-adding enzyme BshC [Pedobacter sp. ELA7]